MNSKGTLADLEAAHERVRAAKTTPEQRAKIRQACAEYTRGMVMGHQSIVLNALDIAALLDDFAALEAELAALRRVEAENLPADRSANEDVPAWRVGSIGRKRGYGPTLAEALADYDAKKEQR